MHIVFLVATETAGRLVLEPQRLMALFAVNEIVLPAQWKPALVMVEFHDFPGQLAMAGLALLAFLPLMLVVFLVAGMAVGGSGLFVEMALMAAFAGDPGMLAFQRIFGMPIMIEQQLFPFLFGMAIRALFPVQTLMDVVFLMTSMAGGGSFLCIERALVAAVAFGGFVLSFQWILGVAVVIEHDVFPYEIRMARPAFLSIVPFMLVVFLMARVAVERSRFVTLVGMAVLARHCAVFAR